MAKLKIYEVMNWLKTLGVAENYYCGKLDDKKEKSLGVYDRSDKAKDFVPVGGYKNKLTEHLQVSLLLHWTKSSFETEDAADKLIEKLEAASYGGFYIGENFIDCIFLETKGAVSVGYDSNGVHEYVVWLDIYYTLKREE